MNSEFVKENFIPEFEKEYNCMPPDITSTGFLYIHALVLGNRLNELREYSKTDIFKEDCKFETSNGFSPLALAFGNKKHNVLKILFPFYEFSTIFDTINFLINLIPNDILNLSRKVNLMKECYTVTMVIQSEIIDKQKLEINVFEHRLSERETYKEAFTSGGMTVLDRKIMTYI